MLREIDTPKLNLGGSKFHPPIAVDMQRWFEFNFWLVEELLDLEAKFKHKNKLPNRSVDSNQIEGSITR